MIWRKKGLIFNPSHHKLPNNCKEFAQSPQVIVFSDFIRVYFSTRATDPSNGKYLSHIAFVDFDLRFEKVLNISSNTVIPLGGLGSFDEHGIFPINLLKEDNRILAYTCGWSRRVSVSVETSTGLAISNDNGLTFQKIGTGPVFTSSLNEPFLVGDSFVRKYDDIYHMWYIYGSKWLNETFKEPPARIYKIGHAISIDGYSWKKQEAVQIIPDKLGVDECQALPTVIKIGDTYHMYFCFRQATDFRNNPNRAYKLGYAYSNNLQDWIRDDTNAGIDNSESGWDAEMMCYPHLFRVEDNIYLLYNGNEFGRQGFGLAILEKN